ncbi:capsule biosynthesis GfcC family protein [Alkalimonas collagenimarina]|uniref:Capsule biosynthesis GfcC family protein n=1 Tax=Alkalimonas collagenimarina TaxID=400390 RepID=A0ABT9H0U6_9GAMM|nr:capsule biosynthesis GfcC family protein [Alkalimonas collagenimarina]MDP4536921.1 capsule biosynthesis GfcC family protein [Alkalimonas collagenimarina]
MRYFRYTLLLILMLSTSSLVASDTSDQSVSQIVVEVQLGDQLLQFTEQPRLLDVLQYAITNASTYWPAASLHRRDERMQEKQQQFLQQLQQLRDHYQTKKQQHKANAIQLLYLQVRQWRVASRIPIVIDVDKARTQLAFNPQLDEGAYYLSVPTRPRVIHPIGLYQEAAPMQHQRATPAKDYLVSGYRLPLSARSHVWILQPDATVKQVGVAYWNRQYDELQPGAQLLIPFAPRALPRAYRHLNDDLLELALHRIVVE